ncbi:MAG TPA: right-handed parallel beta-helix repeat-containing protein [Lentisphaerae bacterium]|jgi:hypothetical protein|nr:right-handed parallel beta-helix repeat-containing protein [Lentisphaerota bacterium]
MDDMSAKLCLLMMGLGLLVSGLDAKELDFAQINSPSALRRVMDARIAEIRATGDSTPPAGVPVYYVSAAQGNDTADGRTPSTAWQTTARLNRENLAPGSWVRYQRGGVYRGRVCVQKGVTYAAYGTGPKPMIYGSPENGADPKKWRRTDNPRVWSYPIGETDVGTLVFDDGAAHAIKIVIRTDKKTGEKFNKYTGRPFNSYRDLDGDLHFWHDYYKDGTGLVYLYSERNPGERFRSIEFNVKTSGFGVGGADDVTIDNFTVKYVGVHGVAAGTCRNLTVSNSEFVWIGGSIQAEGIYGRDYPTRLGNGVEIYGGCENYTVTNCFFDQIYDAGVTHQFNIPPKDGMKRFDQKNVLFAHNVFDRCNYSIEYFLTAKDGNPSRMENILYANNLMMNAGVGFSEQRADRGCAAHVKGWFHAERNRAFNYVIRNNVICHSIDRLMDVGSGLKNLDGSSSMPRLDGNVFIERTGGVFGKITEVPVRDRMCDTNTPAFLEAFGPGNRCVWLEKWESDR